MLATLALIAAAVAILLGMLALGLARAASHPMPKPPRKPAPRRYTGRPSIRHFLV